MPRVAVVQNGTDVARSNWSDTADRYRQCARLISDPLTEVTVDFHADEAAGPLLASIQPDDVAAVVFASNALTSDQVQRAVRRHESALGGFVAAGGGLVVLHQWLDDLDLVVPELLRPRMVTRTSPAPDPDPVRTAGRDDVLLHFPMEVDQGRLMDGGHGSGPSWLYFKAFPRDGLPDAWKAVLVGRSGEAVLVRTDDHVTEHVVLCTPLLDWQGNDALLANIIRWAAFGEPQRLVRSHHAVGSAALLHNWLCQDGLTAVSSATHDGRLSPAEQWLLTNTESHLELLVVPPEDVPALHRSPETLRFLSGGGTMLTTEAADPLPATRITAYVGHYAERTLARALYAELRAVDGWQSVESAFDLRNIAGAVAMLWDSEPNRTAGAVSPEELAPLTEEILTRLAIPRHREDVSSSIALAQCVALLTPQRQADPALVDWMFDRPLVRSFEVRLQLVAVRAGWTGEQPVTFISEAADALGAAAGQLASVSVTVRLLDAVALLQQRGMLCADADEVFRLATLVADQLEQYPPDPDMGWLSIEATADVVRGLLALAELLPASAAALLDRLAEQAVAGASILQRALRRYERNPRGVAWRARLTHALVLADRSFPIGVQRLASMRWPEAAGGEQPRTAAERSLVEHLAGQNRRLAQARDELSDQMAGAREQLERQQLAGHVGRAFATWLPVLALVGGAVALVVKVGSDSVWELLANIGVLATVLVTLLALLFAGLARVGLLASRAEALRSALDESALPVLTSLGKVKGRKQSD